MRKYAVLALVLVLTFGIGSIAWAQNGDGDSETDTTTVTVTAEGFAIIRVPDEATIALTPPDEAGEEDYPCSEENPDESEPDDFLVSHNYANAQVTATAEAAETNAGNDITLEVVVGQNAATVVEEGAVQEGVPCWSGVAGGYTDSITFQVTGATLAATKAGTYTWTVTFTIAEAAEEV